MKAKVTRFQKRFSKYGGFFYYIFFNDGLKSYRTCADPNNRNWRRWKPIIEEMERGREVFVDGLIVKSGTLINADSPVVINKMAKKEEEHENNRIYRKYTINRRLHGLSDAGRNNPQYDLFRA